jgi:hypothetical protein
LCSDGVAVGEGKVRPGRWHKVVACRRMRCRSASEAVKVFACRRMQCRSASEAVKVFATGGGGGSVAEVSVSKAVKVFATGGNSGSVAEESASNAVKVFATGGGSGGSVAEGSASKAVECREFQKGECDIILYFIFSILGCCMASMAIQGWMKLVSQRQRVAAVVVLLGSVIRSNEQREERCCRFEPSANGRQRVVVYFLRSSTEVA